MDNLAKYKKQLILHILTKKNTHIGGYKIVHKCTRATVTMHICTVTIALLYIILIISKFAPFFSLSYLFAKPTPSSSASSSDAHTPIDTKSKINHKNKKSTTDTTKPNTLTHGHTNKGKKSGSALVDQCL